MQTDFDKVLSAYFTDVEHLRKMFKNLVAAPTLTKHLLVIHGVGGVGKSSLLCMFRLHCRSVRVPVAHASGDEQKSELDVLVRWTDDLKKADGVALHVFDKTYAHYRALHTKVYGQAKKAQDARGRVPDIAGKAVSKTGGATGALGGAAIGSLFPGIGTAIGGVLGSVLGGMSAEAIVDWLRGFLKQPDIDLLFDPAKKLTNDFLTDVKRVADKRRIVLMLDTFEQMTELEEWVRNVAQQLPANALFVIAGRVIPNWGRTWLSWMAQAEVEELELMSEDNMRQLMGRYYATMRGGEPDPKQLEAIIRFARGFPMVVTSAVQLWVEYGAKDFQAVKSKVLSNLVDRMIEGVPKELVPVLKAAAIVRWFDQPVLRAVTGQTDVSDAYDELRRFPSVRPWGDWLTLHDAVREIMEENLRVVDYELHRELHERAATHFENLLEKAKGEEAERWLLERLYHRIRADEDAGIKLFQEIAEELVRHRLVHRLSALMSDVSTYSLVKENSQLWQKYYGARLANLKERWEDAERVYKKIEDNEQAEPKLRAYALCDHGAILSSLERRREAGSLERAIELTQRAFKLAPLDEKLVLCHTSLSTIYAFEGNWEQAEQHLGSMLRFYEGHDDAFGVAEVCFTLRWYKTLTGNWKKMLAAHKCGVAAYKRGVESVLPYFGFSPIWREKDLRKSLGWVWMGQYSEFVAGLREIVESVIPQAAADDYTKSDTLCWLAYGVGVQGKFQKAHELFSEAFEIRKDLGVLESRKGFTGVWYGFWGSIYLQQGDFERAEEYLEEALEIKRETQDSLGFPELLVFLGKLHEICQNRDQAQDCYHQCLDYRWIGRHYFECSSLAGIVRVKYAQGYYEAIPAMLVEAEALAQRYEYNDHLASLRLMQAHIARDGHISEWGNDFDSALRYYQLALIHALRYNRFSLDEVLSGRSQGTPLRPIIPYCLELGEEGRRMLTALLDWWKTGVNDIGTPRPDTISPIPEGIALLEAESIAREREPGDGSPQRSVVEQIEEALKETGAG